MIRVLAVVLAVLALLAVGGFLWLRAPDVPYEVVEARYATPDSRYLDLGGGLRIHYVEAGDPARPAVLLVHGYGDSFASWEGWVRILRDRFHVLALDLPGHGLTRAPADWVPSGPAYVDVVERFVRARALPPFAIAGNSMGGGVAWSYALAHPERLSALVLVDAAGWPLAPAGPPPLAFRILRYPAGRWLLAQIDNRPLIVQGLKVDVHDPSLVTDAFVDRWAAFQRLPGHRRILMAVPIGSFGTASDAALARITAPTLVLHGADDRLIPAEHGRRFAAAIPGAKLVVFDDVGHLPQVEIPERSAGEVAAFLGALPAPPAAR
jgi:pimeloyl-ACP methyl ester carboxylesterase